jgi:ribosomal protein S27E
VAVHYKVRFHDIVHDRVDSFRVSGADFWDALDIVEEVLGETLGDGAYNILLIKAEMTINEDFINPEGDVSREFIDIECPGCKTINKIPFGMSKFKCQKCAKDIAIDYNSHQDGSPDENIEDDGED